MRIKILGFFLSLLIYTLVYLIVIRERFSSCVIALDIFFFTQIAAVGLHIGANLACYFCVEPRKMRPSFYFCLLIIDCGVPKYNKFMRFVNGAVLFLLNPLTGFIAVGLFLATCWLKQRKEEKIQTYVNSNNRSSDKKEDNNVQADLLKTDEMREYRTVLLQSGAISPLQLTPKANDEFIKGVKH